MRTLWKQPFMVARMHPVQFDPQAGSRIAEWRSDDADGPQWRLADATVDLELPPQAVGEEMERGKRFWPAGTSTIRALRAEPAFDSKLIGYPALLTVLFATTALGPATSQ